MSAPPPDPPRQGIVARTWRRLTSPSARWSVLALLAAGVALGFVATAGTQVMVAVTGTDEFCGGACHSMQWVAKEHKQSVHYDTRTGVRAGCSDCHIPHNYPEKLVYKTKAGIKDTVNELRGILSTEEKFKKERLRMAKAVWAEYKETNSANCRVCHVFTPEVLAKQKEFAQPMHRKVLDGEATCIDCHKGVAHTAPDE
jgi:nitrate/TMAO reductase-like tetraheme cytochrome c subunit